MRRARFTSGHHSARTVGQPSVWVATQNRPHSCSHGFESEDLECHLRYLHLDEFTVAMNVDVDRLPKGFGDLHERPGREALSYSTDNLQWICAY